jgi:hypothetical protein
LFGRKLSSNSLKRPGHIQLDECSSRADNVISKWWLACQQWLLRSWNACCDVQNFKTCQYSFSIRRDFVSCFGCFRKLVANLFPERHPISCAFRAEFRFQKATGECVANFCSYLFASALIRLQITLSKYLVSDTGVVVTVTLQPVIAIVAGSKLMVTVTGDLAAAQAQLVTVMSSPIAASFVSSQFVSSRELLFTFGVNVAANSILKFSVGSFRLPSASMAESDVVEAALLDPSGNVVAPSSTGSYPAIFASAMSGSSVNLSSSVANARDVSVTVTLFASIPIVSMFRLSGLGFVAFAGSSAGRRLLQDVVLCNNLNYSGNPVASYNTIDSELTVTFPGGGATVSNSAIPFVCRISGFRNPAAAVASFRVTATTYDQFLAGHGIQSEIHFPPILCASGYLQTVTGSAVDCSACPKGTYSHMPGSLHCLQCPSGTYSNTTAAASQNSCTRCPLGTFSGKSGASDASACSYCPPGTNSSLLGAMSCASCTAGSYAESHGQTHCDLCPAGSYSIQQNASSRQSCITCPAGTFSKSGSIICLRCLPGTSSAAGSGNCQPCVNGTYSDTGDECFKCPGITHSLANGSSSLRDCSGILVDIGGRRFAYTVGIVIVTIYIFSFSLVPSWSSTDKIMRFQLTANFDGKLNQNRNSSNRIKAWLKRVTAKRKARSGSKSPKSPKSFMQASEKRFFEVGDCVMWQKQVIALNADVEIGSVESTSVYHEQDADELSDFVVLVKMKSEFVYTNSNEDKTELENLQEAFTTAGSKPILFVQKCKKCKKCCCQLKEAPASHAHLHLPFFRCKVGPWEIVRQINACFQLLLLSIFPAIDTVSDLVYILSSVFANYFLFAASLFCITVQFWLYVTRLKQHHVFDALKERHINEDYLEKLSYWPKWARPDNLLVVLTILVPFYLIYYVIFPVVWFFVGYAIYSFQLFPISRISNRWLYAFV